MMDQPKPHDLAYFKNSHCVERGHIDHMPGCPPAKTEVKVLGFVNGVAFVRIVYEVELIQPLYRRILPWPPILEIGRAHV